MLDVSNYSIVLFTHGCGINFCFQIYANFPKIKYVNGMHELFYKVPHYVHSIRAINKLFILIFVAIVIRFVEHFLILMSHK